MELTKLTADKLVLGDQVRLLEDPYGWGTVVNIADEHVEIFRVYVHIGDFEYTGGVLHYIGSETVKVWTKGVRVFEVDACQHERMAREGALK